MKVVDQESIRQRNSKPISRETQSNQHKYSKTVGKKKIKQYQVSAAEPQSKIATLERC